MYPYNRESSQLEKGTPLFLVMPHATINMSHLLGTQWPNHNNIFQSCQRHIELPKTHFHNGIII